MQEKVKNPFLEQALKVAAKNKPAAYQENYPEIAARLVAAGFTEEQLAYALGTDLKTLRSWKRKYPLFKQACKHGKETLSRFLIAKGLYEAVGYDYETTRYVRKRLPDGSITEEKVVQTHHKPADHHLLTFFLINIDRQLGNKDWVSAKRLEIDESKKVHIRIDGKLESERIAQFAQKLLKEPPRKEVESREIKQVNNNS